MTIIALEHVSKTFEQRMEGGARRVQAVRDVSFKLSTGTVLAILGPSGCGKSTLLRLIAGLEQPDSGRVTYDSVALPDVPLRDRGIGMVFQDGALMPHWESRQSVGFFLWLRQREHEVPERVRRIAQITGFGLEALMERKPGELSGGERQRVAIARALARDPRVFLFDEPFSNLDAKLRGQARVELKRLLNEFPVTSVYVTHDQIEAVALAHRIAVMREGHLEQIGTYQHLYHNPVNQFIAGFIGTPPINFFAGHVQGHHWHGQAFGGFDIRHDLADGAPVTLGVRPESMRIAEGGLSGRVEAVTPFYAERFLLLEVTRDGERWQMMVPPETALQPGQTIACAPDPGALHFFDSATGLRIG